MNRPNRPSHLPQYGPPLFHSYVEVEPPRLVCLKCGKDGHVILPPPHDNDESKMICPHCGYDNLHDPENFLEELVEWADQQID